jgi:hypothetical protein
MFRATAVEKIHFVFRILSYESLLMNSLIRYCDVETKDDRLITLPNSTSVHQFNGIAHCTADLRLMRDGRK